MNISARLQELRSGFSPTFWVANTLELFERLAFYGSKGILAVFIAEKVGLNEDAGLMAATFTSVIYFLPVLAGVFVDKYGFRNTLMACFFIFCIGYLLIGLAGMQYGQQMASAIGIKAYTWIVLMLTAVGGSLIKPCIVGTVAMTTTDKTKTLGFSIYYTLVNLGGAIGPILAYSIRTSLGIEFVLIMSSFTSLLMLLGTFLFFREPVPSDGAPTENRTFQKIFGDMLLVFTNLRFMTFLIIFSGFWMMFWQIFILLPFYAKDVLKFEAFEFLETVDAFCIIFLTIPVTAFMRRFKPITGMTMGFTVASLSWILMGAIPTVTAAAIAIAIYALGEAMQSPQFYAYVSNLAPRGQVGTFMGFAFLPVAIGAQVAGFLSDWLRLTYMQTNPAMMWYINAGIGLVATILMILYNQFIAPKNAQ